MNIKDIENLRLRYQGQVDSMKTMEERNRLGQYATERQLANEIMEFTLDTRKKLGLNEDISFLEPAVGTGAFYSALLEETKQEGLNKATGIEVDKAILEYAMKLWGDSLELINCDFTQTDLDSDEMGVYNLLVTNPPYIRHHHLEKHVKDLLKGKVKQETGFDISGLAGLHAYFILLSDKWLTDGALASWLIPAEFMSVNYGEVIRQYLTDKVTLTHIHKYDSEDAKFEDALVSSSVVMYQKQKPDPSDVVTFSYGGSIKSPRIVRKVTIGELKNQSKWSMYVSGEEDSVQQEYNTTLSDYFKIKRGIATGKNDFFILTENEVEELGLPFECLRPILPPPKMLKDDFIIEADSNGTPLINQKYYVLDTDLDEDKIEVEYPNLYKYLQKGIEMGVTQGYLVKKRKVWYSQESRTPAPFLCSYMGRKTSTINPFTFIHNKSDAICTNGYLMLYPYGLLKEKLDQDPTLFEKVYKGLQGIGFEQFFIHGREYGGGLNKVEPKELAKIPADIISEIIDEKEYYNSKQMSLLT